MADAFRFSPRPNRAGEIRWREWGEEVFQEAAEQDKLVLLSISAVWCHWCHVMDETTYSDPEIIAMVNRDFIPVRVDNDRQPEINRRYNQGGWPTTVFLSPQGALLAGATYIPPQQLREALRRFGSLWREKRGEISRQLEEALKEKVQERKNGKPVFEGGLHPGIRDEVWRSVSRHMDHRHGGLGGAPKFPMFEALELALDLFLDRDDPAALAWAELTAHKMMDGGIYDRVEGGIFRYSTTPDWSIPHYEKMLTDNAHFVSFLLRLYALTGKSAYSRAASQTLAYMAGVLSDGDGRFFGSQDADERYYQLKEEERRRAPSPPVDRTVYVDSQAAAAATFLKGGTVLGRPELLQLGERAAEVLVGLMDADRGLPHYLAEGKVGGGGLLEDQAATLEAFLQAHQHLSGDRWLKEAQVLASLVLREYREEEKGGLLDVDPRFLSARLEPQPADISTASLLARSLFCLFAFTGDPSGKAASRHILESYAAEYPLYGFHAASYARAVDLYYSGHAEVRLSGWKKRGVMERIVLSSPISRLIYINDGYNMYNVEEAPDVEEEEAGTNAAICRDGVCRSPISDPAALAESLRVRILVEGNGGQDGSSLSG